VPRSPNGAQIAAARGQQQAAAAAAAVQSSAAHTQVCAAAAPRPSPCFLLRGTAYRLQLALLTAGNL
jgi:hypothetical protein